MEEPQPGIQYPVVLGPTLLGKRKAEEYCSLRYDFLPQSVARTGQGHVEVQVDSQVLLHLPSTSGSAPVAFAGRQEHSKDGLDCVAIFDGTQFRLEVLHASVKGLRPSAARKGPTKAGWAQPAPAAAAAPAPAAAAAPELAVPAREPALDATSPPVPEEDEEDLEQALFEHLNEDGDDDDDAQNGAAQQELALQPARQQQVAQHETDDGSEEPLAADALRAAEQEQQQEQQQQQQQEATGPMPVPAPSSQEAASPPAPQPAPLAAASVPVAAALAPQPGPEAPLSAALTLAAPAAPTAATKSPKAKRPKVRKEPKPSVTGAAPTSGLLAPMSEFEMEFFGDMGHPSGDTSSSGGDSSSDEDDSSSSSSDEEEGGGGPGKAATAGGGTEGGEKFI